MGFFIIAKYYIAKKNYLECRQGKFVLTSVSVDLKLKLIIMRLNIENQTKIDLDLSLLEGIRIRSEQIKLLPEDYTLDLSFCDGTFIRQHNKMFRGLDQKTDVLSFELTSTYGSMLICLEYLRHRSGNKALAQDLQSVFAHGLCHLAGYDHFTDEQKRAMQTKEKALLQVAK